LIALWGGSMLLAWMLLVVGWFWAEDRLTKIGNRVITDMRALSEARDLESKVLAFKRDDLLWQATGQIHHHERGSDRLLEAERIAAGLDPYVTTADEADLAVRIQSALRAFREQWILQAHTPLIDDVQWTDDLLEMIDQFQAQNESQMEESIAVADQLRETVTHWSIGLSVGAAVLLSIGALSLLRRVIRPTAGLTEVAKHFGQGDFAVRAVVSHDDELGALSRTFNNMAGDIADREKNRRQFVAMVVHDLKNPVLAIEMAARLLPRPDTTEEERLNYLNGITEEAAHLRGIIGDLTDDIQVANGRFSIHKAEVDLGALVKQFTQTQCRAFTAHEILVKTDEGCVIQGDARRIERVVMNLLSNAVKYSPPNTRVTLRVEKEDSQAVLTVSDQGPGIAKDDLGVLFQPFGRGRSADALAEGTGMGLYVVKQIVEAHDGRIDVQSELGHGATFRVRLPLAVR
jgi:signal transduction histidine kinase